MRQAERARLRPRRLQPKRGLTARTPRGSSRRRAGERGMALQDSGAHAVQHDRDGLPADGFDQAVRQIFRRVHLPQVHSPSSNVVLYPQKQCAKLFDAPESPPAADCSPGGRIHKGVDADLHAPGGGEALLAQGLAHKP